MAQLRSTTGRAPAEPARPDPQRLLAKLHVEDQRLHHASALLRIYLGAAPGVGKTFAMLNEGQRRRARGTDVVIGDVETYGRPLTIEAADGLETVPRRALNDTEPLVEEMDIEAIIARHPSVALVDELSHTNAPGSRHERRWQDVQDLLEAGITVITTLNIQHLESLAERVRQITGLAARDLVPDWVVDRADDIELIDMAPEALRSRLRHGNIYPPDRAARELEGLFLPGNLAALRELALRRTAEEVDGQLVSYMQQHGLTGWLVDERVLVCIDHRPLSQVLIRRAWQTAQGLKCPLTAVHVRSARLCQKDRLLLEKRMRQARELGADVRELDGDDVVATIARFVADSRITQVVVGHPRRSRWRALMRGSLASALLRQLPDIDIRIVPEGEPGADAEDR